MRRLTVALGAAGLIGVALLSDYLIAAAHHGTLTLALIDWSGHLATGALVLLAARGAHHPDLRSRGFCAGVLFGSVVIDADHAPAELFHRYWLTAGTPRPYSHSALTVLVLTGVALLRRRHPQWRRVATGLAAGVAFHLVRDTAIPVASGVSLWWPLTDRSVHSTQQFYVGVLVAMAVVACATVGGPGARPRTARLGRWRRLHGSLVYRSRR